MFACPATDDFFRSRIDQMIDLRHPLAVLSSRMPWQELEARVAHLFVRKAHEGVACRIWICLARSRNVSPRAAMPGGHVCRFGS